MKALCILLLFGIASLSYQFATDLSNLAPEFASWLESEGYETFRFRREEIIRDEDIHVEVISDGFIPEPNVKDQAQPYLTPHFSAWLNASGYSGFNFERYDISGGSFGGKVDDNDTVVNQPVIFIHGNGDRAYGDSSAEFNGFADSINYFLSQGYKTSELYATTWGPASILLVAEQYHSYTYLNYLRNFVEAVLKYTGASKIDIISHSMGVTLGRKVIKGGTGDDGGSYDLGPSLASNVDTFLGIAGANWGLTTCYTATTVVPTCSAINGFFPGVSAGPIGLSIYLDHLNNEGGREGDYVFGMLSLADDVILFGDVVWGQFTSRIPGSDDTKIYTDLGHMALKSKTCDEQLKIITQHQK